MKTVIVDIDGTLADCRHRLHHVQHGGKSDWPAFFGAMADDSVIDPVKKIVQVLAEQFKIVLCSGRPEDYRAVTEAWLDEWCIPFDALYMRPAGDTRPDHIVKAQLLRGLRKDGYDPFIVIDDRQSVVDMWREDGLVCLQAAPSQDVQPPKTAALTLMVGPCGSGKTTWLQSNANLQHVVSSDQIRHDLTGDFKDQTKNTEVFAALHAVVRCRLMAGLPVIVDATNIRRKDRVSLAFMFDIPVTYLVINRPVAEKLRDGAFRLDVPGLIEKHESIFASNEKDIVRGDDLPNVTVHDLRYSRDPWRMELAA